MTAFALVCNYEGDYGMKLLMVDSNDTMDDIARIARENIASVFVPEPPPGTHLRVRKHGGEEFIAHALTVADAGFVSMETVDIIHVRD